MEALAPVANSVFADYVRPEGFDEMFSAEELPRPPYELLYKKLQSLTTEELVHRQRAADQAFIDRGITFTVYGHGDGTERIIPYDVIPRILSGAEWEHLERGLTQRIVALNHFLKDVYGEGMMFPMKSWKENTCACGTTVSSCE